MKSTLQNPMGSLNWVYAYGDDDTRVGTFQIRKDLLTGQWSIWAIEVYDEFRGFGHGRAMVKSAIDEILNRGGVGVVYLFVRCDNGVAINLYNSLGFTPVLSWGAPRNIIKMEAPL